MDRRRFITRSVTCGIGLPLVGSLPFRTTFSSYVGLEHSAGGLDLIAAREMYREQLFSDYLPFWEKGGFDEKYGGFMCYLFDDGTVQDERKDIWYQGRGIWVYSFLYNHIDRTQKWLDMAATSRNFMVEHMHRGDGTWLDTVDRRGAPADGIDYSRDGNIYGALFAAVGLIQYAKATGSEKDLRLARRSILKSVQRYEDSSYRGIAVNETVASGLRAQGHSFMFAWAIPQYLELEDDDRLEAIVREHVNHLQNSFWNDKFGISNEILLHNYEQIPELSDHMVPGHSIEAQWMAMSAVEKIGEATRADLFRSRMKRLAEMSWDHVYGGIGDTSFRVEGRADHPQGADYSIKTMWAQTEVAVGMLKVFADTRADWALAWYNHSWNYIQSMMTTDYGVWRQAVDRKGQPIDRPGISIYRKGNFHQPRCLMMNLLEIERMIDENSDG